eukprot:jgi/Picre1/30826/NNA_006186.t1
MKIEVPLSPWESDVGNVTPNENATAKPVSGRKPTPFRSKKVHQLNENSPDVRSFCLDRPPLADIGNEGNVTESARDKVVGDLITLTPMTGHKNNSSEEGTPKIFTGGKGEAVERGGRAVPVPDLLSFDPLGDPDTGHEGDSSRIQQLEETIEFLEGELVKSKAPQDALEKEVEELKGLCCRYGQGEEGGGEEAGRDVGRSRTNEGDFGGGLRSRGREHETRGSTAK